MATAGVIDTPTDSDSDLEDSKDNIGTTGVDTDKEEESNIGTTEAPCRSSRGQLLDTGRKHPVEDEYQFFKECLIWKMMVFSHRKRYAKLQLKMNIATSSIP